MEVVAVTGIERRRPRWRQAEKEKKWIQDRIGAAGARKYQILIERDFPAYARRKLEDRIAPLDVVSNTDARLGLTSHKDVVKIAPESQVEGPVSFGDRILNIEREFFDVCMP